jgi:hypothetical protein
MNAVLARFARQQLGSIVRAGLLVVGSWLVSQGVTQEEADALVGQTADVVIGAATILGPMAWSWYRNRQIARKIEGA